MKVISSFKRKVKNIEYDISIVYVHSNDKGYVIYNNSVSAENKINYIMGSYEETGKSLMLPLVFKTKEDAEKFISNNEYYSTFRYKFDIQCVNLDKEFTKILLFNKITIIKKRKS